MRSRMEFNTFNSDKTATQTIRLVSARRGPPIDGLILDVAQPERPFGPQQVATAALVANVPASAPTTDLPRQRVHVPPTAGRNDAVVVQVKGGDRVHLAADGDGGPLIGSIDRFETSFLIGDARTIVIPEKNQGLRLAIDDRAARSRENAGRGFDVEAWTMPVASAAEPPFPEVHIAAATFQQIRIAGVDKTYTVPTNLGAVTYQLLIADQGAAPPAAGKTYWLWLILLIVLVIAVLIFLRMRKRA
jgi:hypothetical protein